VVCTLTALVILVTGTYDANVGKEGLDGIALTSEAFASVIPWFPVVLMVAVILFAFSTMISWSYYGERAIVYLCGGARKGVLLGYRLFFCVCTVLGCSMTLTNVVTVSDALFFAMVVPNLIGIYLLLPVVKRELASFIESAKASS
jgi:AGCS family alanine or glycine:cation symporter